MRGMTAEELKNAVNGSIYTGCGEETVTRAVIDSREAGEGDVFFAMKGEKNDGHNFLEQVRHFLDHSDPEGTYRRQICIYLLQQFFLCDWNVDDFYAAFDEKLKQARQHLGFAG